MIFFSGKMDPIVRMKIKEKENKSIPVIISLKEPPSKRFKNSISKNNGKLKYEYKFTMAVAAQLSCSSIERLSELPEVRYISYDRKAEICMDKTPGFIGINHNNPYGLTGKGVNIAIIDTGVYLHGDLCRPRKAIFLFRDYINSINEPYDDNGHGTHICGIIAGSGALSDGKYKGIATGSRLIMLKAFNSVGEGAFSDIIAAIEWVMENKEKYQIKILCLPFGGEAVVPYSVDPLSKACETAWNNGIIVIAPSGNKGPLCDTITTPGICPSIITVGCCQQTDMSNRGWKVADFSGRGIKKDNIVKPDFVAPGVNITSLSTDRTYIPGSTSMASLNNPYCAASGTSVSCGVAAGCIALLLEKMPSISGKDLKGILKLSCHSLNEPKTSQGYGIINMQEMI